MCRTLKIIICGILFMSLYGLCLLHSEFFALSIQTRLSCISYTIYDTGQHTLSQNHAHLLTMEIFSLRLNLEMMLVISHLIHHMMTMITSMIILRRTKLHVKMMMKSMEILMCQWTANLTVLTRVLQTGFCVLRWEGRVLWKGNFPLQIRIFLCSHKQWMIQRGEWMGNTVIKLK